MYVIYDRKNNKAITEPSTAISLTKIYNRLHETDGDRYELRFIEEKKMNLQQKKSR